ncbi:MAG: histidine kinase [Gammaproteobacteria bacterium]|nr:histidine kinase [Gammaproteobacteria bacterium]
MSEDYLQAPSSGDWFFTRWLNSYPILRILISGRMLVPMGALVVTLTVNLILALLVVTEVALEQNLAGLSVLISLVAAVAAFVGAVRLRSKLLVPLSQLEQSVADVCQGEPWSTLPMETVGVLGPVARDLDSLSGELIDLYEDMDNRVARQTRRLGQQTTALKVLYDVAASINRVEDMDALLLRFMVILKELVHGRAATVQLYSLDGNVRLVGSVGPEGEVLTEAEQLPVTLCECGKALSSGEVICEHNATACSELHQRRMYSVEEMEEVRVPLSFHGDELGLYRIFVKKPGLEGRDDIRELLAIIGTHIGIAIAKQRTDAEAHRLSIIEERTSLAHELHDSLAQTLASLRFQVRMLDETLEQSGASDGARRELERLRNGLDEAHTELRELLNNFRAPVDERGLELALDKLVERFRQETGVQTFFQSTCRQINLSASEEMQMLRIVQESLTNIRKHAHAHTVRVLLTCRSDGEYLLLVEDDGKGFDSGTTEQGSPGEHIGLSIMTERAYRLGAGLKIESEPGEGTRVELIYNPDGLAGEQEQERIA